MSHRGDSGIKKKKTKNTMNGITAPIANMIRHAVFFSTLLKNWLEHNPKIKPVL